MINQCSAHSNHFPENMPQQSCNSVTSDISHSTCCETVNPPLHHQNISNNVTSSDIHPSLPNNLHANVLHQGSNQNLGSMKQQDVSSCPVSCLHQDFNSSNLDVEQLMNPTNPNGSNSNITLNSSCEPHILVSHTSDHTSLTNQMASNQPSNSNQMNAQLNDQLSRTVIPNLSNSNQHIIVNLMNSAVNHPEIPSINPSNQEMSNSGVMSLNHHIESNMSGNMNLSQQINNVNMSHQNMNIPLLSMNNASPNLSFSQNINNLSSNIPMNLLMPDPIPNQSNAILTSYHSSSSCGNYSPFDSSISWLTDNRNFLVDRSYNNSRLGMLENISLCSPNSVESLSRNNKETGNYSTKCLPSLHDPVQSWLNISSITNQSPMKYNDQISPNINLLHFEQSDLQKFDLSHKTSDIASKNMECMKSTELETKNGKNYESPKHKLNYGNQAVLAINTEFSDSYEYNIPSIHNVAPCYPIDLLNCKYGYNFSSKNPLDYPVTPISEMNESDCGKMKQNSLLPSCAKNNVDLKDIKGGNFSHVMKKVDIGEHCSIAAQPASLFDGKLSTRSTCMKAGEMVCDDIDLDNSCSGSEESDICVEDSDSRSADDDQNEISVDSVKTILIDEDIDFSGTATPSTITLRCFICDLSTTTVPANQFIHTNSEFPVMSASKIPAFTKLLEIIHVDLQKYVTIENHFMCCRCFNLIETVESLEMKLKSVKDILNETLSRTITIVNIRDSKLNKVEMSSLEELRNEWFDPRSPDQLVKNSGDQKIIEKAYSDLSNEVGVEPGLDADPLKTVNGSQEVVECGNSKTEDNLISIDEDDTLSPEKNLTLQFPCTECGQTFNSLSFLSDHCKTHLTKFSVACSDCGKGFKSKSKLAQHVLVHNGDFTFLCEICGKAFRQKHHFKDHILKHLGKFKFRCKTCNKGFMQKSTLRIHLSMHLPLDPQICQHCGKKFSNKWNLTSHISVCINELKFPCEFCEKKFNDKHRLDDHVQCVHENNFKFNCNKCKKGFMKKSSLEAHMVVHSNLKSFICQKCGKSYKTLSNLNQHSKVHSVSAQFKCTLCDAKFLRKSALEAHLNNHSGHKPYKCSECAKIFASEHYLNIHRKQHDSQNKGGTCLDCGKLIKNDLKAHRCNVKKKCVPEAQIKQT